MNPYTSYKPSGIDWIGDIPKHWDLRRLKYEAIIQGGYAFKSDEFVEDGIPIVRIGDVAPNIDLENCKKTSEINIPNEFKLHKNDTLIALSDATVGKRCIGQVDMNTSINLFKYWFIRVHRITHLVGIISKIG